MNKIVLVFLLTLLMPLVVFAQQAPERVWKTRTGRRVVARYVGSSNDTNKEIFLRTQDGNVHVFNINEFCSDDQKWVIEWTSPEKANPLKSYTSEGIGVSKEKAIADAERNALTFINGSFSLGKQRINSAGLGVTRYSEEITHIYSGFIRSEKILNQWKDDEGMYHVIINFSIYQHVLNPLFANILTREENIRRNNAINNQVLRFYKFFFNDLRFPEKYYSFNVSNVTLNYKDLNFNITTFCDRNEYMAISSEFRFVLGKFAITRGNFHLNSTPFLEKGYKNVYKFHEVDINRSIVDLKTYKDRIFICVCLYTGNDGSTSWEVFELPRKFMFVFEPYAHLMTGIQVDILDKNGNVIKRLPPVLPEVKPFSPRAASLVGIWDARFRSRMKDEGVFNGSQFATFNPSQPYNYDFVEKRFRGIDPLANLPYSLVYSIQPFFLSRYNDKTNLIFPKLTREFSVELTSEQIRKLPADLNRAIRVRVAPLNETGKQYISELERKLQEEIE